MFGKYKQSITDILARSYATNKKLFKESFHSLMGGLRENKLAREFFVLYGEIENKKFHDKGLAEEYLDAVIKTLKSKKKNLRIPVIKEHGYDYTQTEYGLESRTRKNIIREYPLEENIDHLKYLYSLDGCKPCYRNAGFQNEQDYNYEVANYEYAVKEQSGKPLVGLLGLGYDRDKMSKYKDFYPTPQADVGSPDSEYPGEEEEFDSLSPEDQEAYLQSLMAENKIYPQLDGIIFNESVRSIEKNLRYRRNLVNHLTRKDDTIKITESIPTSILATLATNKFNKKYASLNKEESKQLKEYLEIDKKKLKEEFSSSKIEVLDKLNSLKEVNEDKEVLNKLNEVITQMDGEKLNKFSLYKLNKLKKELL